MDKLGSILEVTRSVQPPKGVPKPPVEPLVWEAAVGSRIANRAQPMRLERGILSVRVANAAWANELSLLSADILRQLAERGVEVKALRFKVGQIRRPAKARRGKPRNAAPPDAKLPSQLRQQVAAIDHEPLKEALAEACAKSLAVKERNPLG